jgi:hypothetical protein
MNPHSYAHLIFVKVSKTCDVEKTLSSHPKLNQEDINHLNKSITSSEIEAAIVSQKRKVPDLTDSVLNSTRALKKN